MNYDTVIVLDNGLVVECDSPQNLLTYEKGVFASLMSKSKLLNVWHVPSLCRNHTWDAATSLLCITTPCCGHRKHCPHMRFFYNYLIDSVCFRVIFVVPSAAVSRRNWSYFSRLHCTVYTYNMAAATLNIDVTVTIFILRSMLGYQENQLKNAVV